MNRDELRVQMIIHRDSQRTLAEALGIALSTFNAKMNGKNGAEFTKPEIELIAKRYDLDIEAVGVIFFPNLVSKKDTSK